MTPDKVAPLFGFSLALILALAAMALFVLMLSALIPFILMALRKQSREQLEVLRRIEGRLADQQPPVPPPPAAPALDPASPANVN